MLSTGERIRGAAKEKQSKNGIYFVKRMWSVQDELPYLETTKQKLIKEKQELENQIKAAKAETCVLKKDEDVLISEILKV